MAVSTIKSSERVRGVTSIGAITTTSTVTVYDALSLPNDNAIYLVIFGYFSYTFANSASAYIFVNGASNHCYGVNCLYKGSEGRSIEMSNTGVLKTTSANTYNAQAILIRLN